MAHGVAVPLVEQKVQAALEVAGCVAFVENGPVRLITTPTALAADPEPSHRYVGVGR